VLCFIHPSAVLRAVDPTRGRAAAANPKALSLRLYIDNKRENGFRASRDGAGDIRFVFRLTGSKYYKPTKQSAKHPTPKTQVTQQHENKTHLDIRLNKPTTLQIPQRSQMYPTKRQTTYPVRFKPLRRRLDINTFNANSDTNHPCSSSSFPGCTPSVRKEIPQGMNMVSCIRRSRRWVDTIDP
jgi:hypothetical protein